jgi:hypothetical protein
MVDKLFPRIFDNHYRGAPAALWILGILVALKGAMGINCIFNGYRVATTADGIALDAFTPAGATAVVAFLGLWGLAMLLFSLLGVLALARYRAMVPLVFVVLLVEHIGRKMILFALPVASTGATPAFSINTGFLALTVIGLVLSMARREELAGATT